MDGQYATPAAIAAAAARLGSRPERAAAFFDLDGTLAPIVARPEDARVPQRTRELIARIAERYRLVGVVSGRRATDARRIMDLDRLTYLGNHGFELLAPGAERAAPSVALTAADTAGRFAAAIDPERLRAAGLRVEDKGAIIALHWRGAPDPDAAQSAAATIAAEAEAEGLSTHRGRMVLELRPPVAVDKGVALAAVLSGEPIEAAFYAGDDRTDADAFRALGELAEAGRLQDAVRVAVVSEETPPEVSQCADLAVAGPAGFVAVLEALA